MLLKMATKSALDRTPSLSWSIIVKAYTRTCLHVQNFVLNSSELF